MSSPFRGFRKPAVVTKHTAVNEPQSADECEQAFLADDTNNATMDMDDIPEGKSSNMDVWDML